MSSRNTILVTGDFCPVNRTGRVIEETGGGNLLNDFLSKVQESGLAVTNLECPLTDESEGITKVGPLLRAPAGIAKTLSGWGFNLVTLANNHIMDYGSSGLRSTIKACNDNNIDHVGAGDDLNEARKAYHIKVGDYRVAILNFAENEFSTTHGNYPGANPLNPVGNYSDIISTKSLADFLIVVVHGGHEMYNLPSLRIRNTLRFFADAGADAVIQHHAHCFSGYEIYKGIPIFYGLGNFIFDKPDKLNSPWNYGYAVKLFLGEVPSFELIPYEQSNGTVGLRQLSGVNLMSFYKEIDSLNTIISDDIRLGEEFENYYMRVKPMYESFLEPHSIRILHFLRNSKLLPSILNNRKKKLYLNLFRSESHREVIIGILGGHKPK